jgi:lysophospholipase L1-like esterase
MRHSSRLISFGAVACVVGACSRESAPTHTATPPTQERWVGTWAAAAQPVMPGTLETFKDQQVRLIVHTSIGGSQARIRLSNEYGQVPLDLGGVTIARRLKGAEVDAATVRTLTFAGKPTASIAPGGALVSDAVAIDIPAFADLAITIRLPGIAEATTNHFLAMQTNYVSPPGTASAATFTEGKTIGIWPFLAAVDVVPRGDAAAVVVFGDSTVDGDGSTADANRRWPDFLARRVSAGDGARQLGVLNLGIIGNRLLRDSPGAGNEFGDALGKSGISRFERDVLGQSGVGLVVVRLGVNDLGFPGSFTADSPPTPAELMDGYRKLAAAAHARGVRIIVTTIAPFGGTKIAGYHSPDKEQMRQELNAWMHTAPEFDGVIDADAALRDAAYPSRLLAAWDSGDHLHPGDAGNEHLAEVVPPSIFSPR